MLNFNAFYQQIALTSLSRWLETLPAQMSDWQKNSLRGKFVFWQDIVTQLPVLIPEQSDLCQAVSAEGQLSPSELNALEPLLRKLSPWRKGPFHLYGIHLDTEWRSDWKWQRLLPHIQPLAGRTVLDVGCGNGYHLWRMVGAGARLAIGIDPSPLFLCQFHAVRKLLGQDQRAHLLPLTLEQMAGLNAFDTVFSMGVLYHRQSPLDHLLQLKEQLIDGGELVLETLVIEGDAQQVLVPNERYAQMQNVYFIPSAQALIGWLKKCGFINIKLADVTATTVQEQRPTSWMNFQSLPNFLDPEDQSKTIEGYPAPQRALLIAQKPW